MELKSSHQTLKIIFYLCLLQILFLIPAFQIGEFYLNSDFSVYYLFADRIGTQSSSPFFYYESTYGGTIIAHVRALFTSIISIFTSSNEFPQFRANQIFTFLIFPLFFTASTFYTCTAFFSRSASLFVGLITAIGLQYWIHRMGSDFYWIAIIYGLLTLRYRMKFKNPFLEMNSKELFLFFLLSGVALYSFKMSGIFLLSFFIPTELRFPEKLQFKKIIPKISVSSFGFLLGFSPELIKHYYFIRDVAPSFQIQSSENIHQSFFEFFLPALQEIVTGSPHLLRYFGVAKYFSYFLFLSASVCGFFQIYKGNKKYLPAFYSALITIIFFLFFKTYVHGASRYLFPLFPFLLLSLGALWEFAKDKKLLKYFVILTAIGSVSFHLQDRFITRAYVINSGWNNKLFETVRMFRENKIKVVVSDDYWESNTYTAISGGNPFFISPANRWAQAEGFALAKSEKSIGILSSREIASKNIHLGQRRCAINTGTKITTVEKTVYLYKTICE